MRYFKSSGGQVKCFGVFLHVDVMINI